MIETGYISKINKDNTALVIIVKSNSGCGSCTLCSTIGNNQKGLIANNKINASINDKVVVYIPENKNNISIFIFLLPILLFFVSYLLTQKMFFFLKIEFKEIYGALISIFIIIIYFIILDRVYKKFYKKKTLPTIKKIIK